MVLNRQFMDFCLCYKIKNKSNTNTGLHPRRSRALSEELVPAACPAALGSPLACSDTVVWSRVRGGWGRAAPRDLALFPEGSRVSSGKGFVRLEVEEGVRSARGGWK